MSLDRVDEIEFKFICIIELINIRKSMNFARRLLSGGRSGS